MARPQAVVIADVGPAESRALLEGARLVSDTGSRARLAAALAAGVRWERLVTRAREDGTAAILRARLSEIDADVPAAARTTLDAVAANTWARNAVLGECWREATRALAASGVRSITHKGIALAHTVYPDPALRPMADLDLLVRPSDAEATTRVLRELGYRTSSAGLEPEEHRRGYRHFARDGVVLDVHWHLAHYERYVGVVTVDHDGVWRRASPLVIGDTCGLTPGPEDTLLHLVLHLTLGSEFGRLVWFVDVDALLNHHRARFDWSATIAEARRWRIASLVAYVLRVCGASFGTPVPADVPAALGRRRVRSALVGLAIGDRVPPSVSGRVTASRVYLAAALMMDRTRDVARILAGVFFPSRTWLRLHYATASPPRLALWRVLHPLRVVWLAALRRG